MNKDNEDFAVTGYPDGLFRFIDGCYNLELTYDGKQRTI
jgi:hypothetical protein